jgi:hypothetical protein
MSDSSIFVLRLRSRLTFIFFNLVLRLRSWIDFRFFKFWVQGKV